MKNLIVTSIFIMSVMTLYSQQVTIFSKGRRLDTKVQATSDAALFTPMGSFKYVDIDSIHSSDKALNDKVNSRKTVQVAREANTPKPITHASKHPDYVEDLPFDENGLLSFVEVINTPGTPNELYLKGKMFFAKTFKSSNDVIQLDDKESATIVGKGFSAVYINSGLANIESRLYYTIKIQGKDGRYRYEISDLYFKSYPNSAIGSIETFPSELFKKSEYYRTTKKETKPKPLFKSYHDELLRGVSSLILSIKEEMSKASSSKDDW